jgi:phage gp36-like protein
MSSYLTIAELENRIGAGTLRQLSNDNDPGTLDTDLLTELITDASEMIDDYLRQAYSVPFDSPSGGIKRACAKIVIYDLYCRRSTPPQAIQTAYDDAILLLEKMGDRKIVQEDEGFKDGNTVSRSYTDEDDEDWAETETLTIGKILTP